jgi:hypothetical protein
MPLPAGLFDVHELVVFLLHSAALPSYLRLGTHVVRLMRKTCGRMPSVCFAAGGTNDLEDSPQQPYAEFQQSNKPGLWSDLLPQPHAYRCNAALVRQVFRF